MSCDSNPLKNMIGNLDGGMPGAVGIPISLTSLLSGLAGRKPKEKENVGVLDIEDVRSWNNINSEIDDLKNKMDILKDKQILFWAQISLKYNVSGRQGLEIDETTGTLMAIKKEGK